MFIVIEGTDGSGKTTQLKLLARRMRKEHFPTRTIAFPRHGHSAAWAVDQYLHGRYGDPGKLKAEVSSILYAVDRFDASAQIRKWIERGEAVISSRYVTSSLVYSAAKLPPAKRKPLWRWIEQLEYGVFGIPRADHTIVLTVPTAISVQLLRERSKKTNQRLDHIERNRRHQNDILALYKTLAATSKNHISLINCAPDGTLLSKEEIHEKIWAVVKRKLVARN
ncbi:deoxynucleoside kinase [Candidatus Uhrbacteria bacterium]|nr:deoxynucleoside kinase [Candidatus Uhrbacteria bacterium]